MECTKRNVDMRAFEPDPIKEVKLKVPMSIQGAAVRVVGAKKDDLQTSIQHVRKKVPEIPVQFGSFRYQRGAASVCRLACEKSAALTVMRTKGVNLGPAPSYY